MRSREKKDCIFQILKWLFIFAMCVLAAYIGERYVIGNYSQAKDAITSDFDLGQLQTAGFTYEEGKLTTTGRYAQITIPAGGYMQQLRMEYETGNMCAIVWTTREQPDYNNLDTTNSWIMDYRSNLLEKTVDTASEILVITFVDLLTPVTIREIGFEVSDAFHWQRFLLLAAALMGGGIVLAGRRTIREHPERAAAAVCILLGVAMLGGTTYEKTSWDDETHFANAYRMSYALVGQDTEWSQAADEFVNLRLPFTGSYSERLNLEKHLDDAGSQIIKTEKKMPAMYYLNLADTFPTALGILIGRLIFPDFTDWFVFARLMNLLFYTVIIYFAIKTTPIGKGLMAFLALLPTPVYLMMTYNMDYFMNALMMLGSAVYLKEFFGREQEISKKNIVIFIAAMFFACLRKTIYIPLILIGLLLPDEKFRSKRQKRIYRIMIVGVCLMELILVMFSASGMSDSRGGDTDVGRQLSHIISNPVSFAIMFVKQVVKGSIDFLFGSEARVNFNIKGELGGTTMIVVFIVMIFLIISARGAKNQYSFDWKTRIMGFAIIGLVICFIWGSMYLAFTPVGENAIYGVSARYYLPFTFLLFLFLPLDWIKCEISEASVMQISLGLVILTNVVCIMKMLMMP